MVRSNSLYLVCKTVMLSIYMLPIAVRIYWANVFLGSVSDTVLDTASLKHDVGFAFLFLN